MVPFSLLVNSGIFRSLFLIRFNLKEEQKKAADCSLAEKCEDLADAPKIKMTTKKMLKGHINKVNSVHYADDSRWVNEEKKIIIIVSI